MVTLSDLVGKTIKSVKVSMEGGFIIEFDDGTKTRLGDDYNDNPYALINGVFIDSTQFSNEDYTE